jgi:hypothetical protein
MTSFAIPDAVLARARSVAADIGRHGVDVDADEVITGRAALIGLRPPGTISAGGATRLIEGSDGWWALTLSRADDIAAVPALLGVSDTGADPWELLAASTRAVADLVMRAQLLDMPAAMLGEVRPASPKVKPHNETAPRPLAELLVVDLSSMWAGPLCGRLLAEAGATVVKVESPERPDGTRSGDSRFFDWMNGVKLSYAEDFGSPELAELVRVADVVIEGSRPAALARRGLAADQVAARPGRVWLRVNGYGSAQPQRVAFGDDAAVAGGLVRYDDGRPSFCGDAIADPLAGLEAAREVLNVLADGGGVIVEVAMAAVAATYAALPASPETERPVRAPALPETPAPELGADNAEVQRLIAARRVAC